MKVSFPYCQSIMETLPIGYYAGRRISVTLNKEGESSYYSPMEDSIVISYPMIAQGLEETCQDTDIEMATRAMFYHEISHAILTPNISNSYRKVTKVQNTFEDERIETLLDNYYLNVDFKDNLYRVTGGPYNAKDADAAFFNAVRFRLAPKDILKEIENIISDYSELNRNSSNWDWYRYCDKIDYLYQKIAKRFAENPEDFRPQNGAGSEPSENQMDSLKGTPSEQNGATEGEGNDSFASQNNADAKKTGTVHNNQEGIGRSIKNPLSKSQIEDMMKKIFNNPYHISTEYYKQVEDFKHKVEMILSNFKKKNSGGSGINAYSGIFNPRAIRRDDYRYFDRAISTQGNNKFGTCHLNLFIDCSGSFHYSEALTNSLLYALSDLEKRNRIFTMDVAFCGEGVHVCESKKERSMTASGGNWLPENLKETFLSMQKPNTCNYNIVLFDGDAFSDSHLSRADRKKTFKAFDYKQTTVITDSDNEEYMEPGFTSAKVVVTKNYTDELILHITNALQIAFG